MTPPFTIVYISPNGSTAKVAQAFADQLGRDDATVNVWDIAAAATNKAVIDRIKCDRPGCLFVGSPVYRDMAVPPIMDFIDALPQSDGAWAVPFVTYGRACSGVALWQMAGALRAKGFQIAGAAKVVALHSMMWAADGPEGEGHPDAEDLSAITRMAEKLAKQFDRGRTRPLPLEALDYQSQERAQEFKAKIDQTWMIIPKTVDAGACTECGVCAEECPVAAIDLKPQPEFNQTCFDCFNCIRLCPEEAIQPAMPLEKIEAFIRERVRTINEQPLTQVFLP